MTDSKPKSLRAKALSIFRFPIWGRSTEKKANAFAKKLNPLTYLSPQHEDRFLQYETRLAWLLVVLGVAQSLSLFALSVNRL